VKGKDFEIMEDILHPGGRAREHREGKGGDSGHLKHKIEKSLELKSKGRRRVDPDKVSGNVKEGRVEAQSVNGRVPRNLNGGVERQR